jgi:hypothetical protein
MQQVLWDNREKREGVVLFLGEQSMSQGILEGGSQKTRQTSRVPVLRGRKLARSCGFSIPDAQGREAQSLQSAHCLPGR